MIASSVLVLNQPVVDAVVAVVAAALVVGFWVVAVAAVLVLVTRSSDVAVEVLELVDVDVLAGTQVGAGAAPARTSKCVGMEHSLGSCSMFLYPWCTFTLSNRQVPSDLPRWVSQFVASSWQ